MRTQLALTLAAFANAELITGTFDNPINYNRDTWLAYIQSQDESILPNDPGYDAYIKDLNAVFDRDSVNGMMRCDRLTRVYIEKIM